jgi:gamma-glutamylcyclotransferase (GGCT)/AIG2-like uncharacterized protein YtfP
MWSAKWDWSCPRSNLAKALESTNRLRTGRGLDTNTVALLESACDSLFGASHHLIVYGSLAPGGSNHRQLRGLEGDWVTGWVTGELAHRGWAAGAGYPALQWSPDGDRVTAHLLTSADLPAHWERLDRFEGPDYRRILVPFSSAHGLIAVGNLYEIERDSRLDR